MEKLRFILFTLLLTALCTSAQATDINVGIYAKNEGRFDMALRVFEPLVEIGYGAAQYELAEMYENGWGLKKDLKKASELYLKAAKQGYAAAQFKMSVIYGEGKILPKDDKASMAWLKKSAALGLAAAQFNYAVALADGVLVPTDHKKAFYWYQQSAFQNYVLAQYNLALMYAQGLGVKKDNIMSYVWNTIAAQNGYKDAARSLEIDRRVLSVEQTKTARYKVQEVLRKIESKRTDLY